MTVNRTDRFARARLALKQAMPTDEPAHAMYLVGHARGLVAGYSRTDSQVRILERSNRVYEDAARELRKRAGVR